MSLDVLGPSWRLPTSLGVLGLPRVHLGLFGSPWGSLGVMGILGSILKVFRGLLGSLRSLGVLGSLEAYGGFGGSLGIF